MKCFRVLLIAAALAMKTSSAHAQLIDDTRYREIPKAASSYSANWWASAQYDERDGFFWGASDCLTDTVHVRKGFFGTSRAFNSDAFAKEVTKYYEEHPKAGKLSVIEVWQKTGRQMGIDSPQTPGGEKYTNPHGFLDGNWYRQSSEADRYGFLEGYIGCVRTYAQASDQPQTYSRPIHYYDDKIWDYVATHNADNEPIADILYRFRDMPKSKPPQAK